MLGLAVGFHHVLDLLEIILHKLHAFESLVALEHLKLDVALSYSLERSRQLVLQLVHGLEIVPGDPGPDNLINELVLPYQLLLEHFNLHLQHFYLVLVEDALDAAAGG